jgi:hypothetical protein
MEAYNRRDIDLALVPFDPNVEAHVAQRHGVPVGADVETTWRGYSGFRKFWDAWDEAWDEFQNDTEVEVLDFGDNVLVLYQFVARGRSSGVEITQPVAMLSTFRNGRLVRWQHCWGWDEALDAARRRR